MRAKIRRNAIETLNTARGLCELAHDTVQLAPAHPLSEAIEQLRQAIECVADAAEANADDARERIAAQVLQGMVGNDYSPADAARWAVKYADALIAVLATPKAAP